MYAIPIQKKVRMTSLEGMSSVTDINQKSDG